MSIKSKAIDQIKKCERCNQEFTCRHDNISECHCMHISISQRALKYLKENYNDCLCNKCTKEIAQKFSDNTSQKPTS